MRTLTTAFKQAINSLETSEIILKLVVINHETWAAPLRICNDNAPVTYGGNVYQPLGFQLNMADDKPDEITNCVLTLDNTDRSIVAQIQKIQKKKLTVDLTVVGLRIPGLPAQIGPVRYLCGNFNFTTRQIQATLTFSFPLDEPIPGRNMTPDAFRALFRT